MVNSVARPIFTHRKIRGSMMQKYPYYIKWVKIIVAILHIDGVRAIFLLFYDYKTLNMSNEKWEIL